MKPLSLLAFSLLLAVPAARADSLYKCDDKGAISIQSDPCPAGVTQVWRRDATPEAGPTPEELAARAALAQAEAQRLAGEAHLAEEARRAEQARREAEAAADARARAEAANGLPARKSECTLAHEFVEGVDAKPWLDLSDAARTRLRDWVAEKCRLPEAPLALMPPPRP